MPSRQQGLLTPSVHRSRLGSFEITSLLDGAIVRSSFQQRFGANASETEVAAVAALHRIEATRFRHQFVATLIDTGRELILFDTGCGELARGIGIGDFSAQLPLGTLSGQLAAAGYTPDDVDVVVLTHGHPDHVGGLMSAGKPTFPNARYVLGAAELDFWRKGDVRPARKVHREVFMKLAAPLADQARLIGPGDDVVTGIRALDAAGHSPGQLAFHVESEGQRLLMWADAAIHYAVSLQHPGWHADVDDDKEAAALARRRILDMAATERIWTTGAHMPFPSLGWVERRNDGGYRWVPVSYQLDL
jgi:glyoxylase-like metal-dependent hydrolase (beta-lactamase superfamily II)